MLQRTDTTEKLRRRGGKIMKKESSLHMILTLVIIAVIVGGLMSFFNGLTAPIIAKNSLKSLNESLAKIIPADRYDEKTDDDCTVYVAYNDDEKAGILVSCDEQGYGGAIKVLTGIDNSGQVVGVEILENSETAGLGANATKQEFRDQYKGKNRVIGVSKTVASDSEIKAITGATITSKAVTAAVNTALEISSKY